MNTTRGIIVLLSVAVISWLTISTNAQNMKNQFKKEVAIGFQKPDMSVPY